VFRLTAVCGVILQVQKCADITNADGFATYWLAHKLFYRAVYTSGVI